MGGSISGHSLQTHGRVDELFDPLIAIVHFFQLRADFQCFFQSNVQSGGHQLRNNIRFGIAEVQCTTHVTDGTTGSHGTEGSDLGHMVGTIFPHNILDHFTTALLTEIRIEVGHGHTFGVQESLENQRILHGVHFRNVHTICHNGSGAGTSARSNRDSLFLGVTDKVPDDQIIVDIAHAGNDANFVFQTVQIFFRWIFISLLEAVITDFPEIFFVGIALRHRKRGQMIFVKHEFQIAHIGNLNSIFKSFVAVGEQAAQLFFALDIKFLGLEFHAVGLVHGSAGLDAQQDILHFRILFPEVVGIIGYDQGQTGFPGQTQNTLIDHTLLVNAMVLQFQIESLRTKNMRHLQSIIFGRLIIFVHQVLGNTTGQTGRGSDQTFMILFQQLQVHTGFTVETMGKGFGNHQAEIFITLPVFTEQYQMIGVIINAMDTVFHSTAGNIHLTADDGLHSCCLGSFVKVDAAVHNTVVRNGNCRLAQFLHPVHQTVNPAGTVQKAVFRMDMKMYKTHTFASLASLAN